MRILQIAAASLAFLLSLSLSLLWKWSQPPEHNDPWPVDPELTEFFRETHDENTAAFDEECAKLSRLFNGVRQSRLPLPSRTQDSLFISVCEIPGDRERILIITSGVHGAEALASSAVQRMFMRKLAAHKERPSVLFIHGINPYGARNFRRVTENNVDLNRNFETTNELFETKNEGYTRIYSLSNPSGPADTGTLYNRFFAVVAVQQIITKGMSALRQAILQGQYEYPKGIYFGGNAFEPQKNLLEPLIRRAAQGKKFAATIDLHTGYGERGTTHLFPNAPESPAMKQLTDALYEGYTVEYAEPGANFYAVKGDFSVFVGRLLAPGTRYVPMVFEYGTLNSQTTPGAIRSYHNTVLENQSAHYGCASGDCSEIKRRYREMFYPSSPAWRSKIMRDSAQLFEIVLDRSARL